MLSHDAPASARSTDDPTKSLASSRTPKVADPQLHSSSRFQVLCSSEGQCKYF